MDELEERRTAPTVDADGIRPPRAYGISDGAGSPGVAVVHLEGELDVAAAPLLRARLAATAAGAVLVLDFSGTTFIDSAVLQELLRARDDLAARDARIVLAAIPRPVARLLELTRTAELFECAPDAAGAVTRLSR